MHALVSSLHTASVGEKVFDEINLESYEFFSKNGLDCIFVFGALWRRALGFKPATTSNQP